MWSRKSIISLLLRCVPFSEIDTTVCVYSFQCTTRDRYVNLSHRVQLDVLINIFQKLHITLRKKLPTEQQTHTSWLSCRREYHLKLLQKHHQLLLLILAHHPMHQPVILYSLQQHCHVLDQMMH